MVKSMCVSSALGSDLSFVLAGYGLGQVTSSLSLCLFLCHTGPFMPASQGSWEGQIGNPWQSAWRIVSAQ